MAFFSWNPKFSVGVEEIDQQHKRLIELINQLHTARAAFQSNDEIYSILNELVDFTRLHFKQEEELLERHGYPEVLGHKVMHYDMVMQVLDFDHQFWNADEGLSDDVLNFLKHWLENHILIEDMKYAAFLAEKQGL